MSNAQYVVALPAGQFEYGYWECETGISPVKKKHKKGIARTMDEAVARNGMTPLSEKGPKCSGSYSPDLSAPALPSNVVSLLSERPLSSPLEFMTI